MSYLFFLSQELVYESNMWYVYYEKTVSAWKDTTKERYDMRAAFNTD